MLGTVFGARILTVMQKMLFALGVADIYINILNGIIMLIAILVGNISGILARSRQRVV